MHTEKRRKEAVALLNQLNTGLGVYSIVVCLMLLIGILNTEDPHDRPTRIIIGMLAFNILALLCDLGAWRLVSIMTDGTLPMLLHIGVYVCGYMLVMLFERYISSCIILLTGKKLRYPRVMPALYILSTVLLIILAANGVFFSFDPSGTFTFGPLSGWIFVYPLFTLLISAFRICRLAKMLGRQAWLSLAAFVIIPLVGVAIQANVQELEVTFTATSMAMLEAYITIHISNSNRLKAQKQELADSRISIMLSQIQPHFLFNSLAAISALCDLDAKKAKQGTVAFSRYLRENLESLNNPAPVLFEKELEHIENYLFLEKLRFEDELKIQMHITVKDFSLPALTLQPLVENAVRYGVGQREDGGLVIISTEDCGGHIEISVEDNGVGFDPDEVRLDGRSHIGISNVRSRLQAICGGSLTVISKKGEGTRAIITLPK